jgi:hypothetical protein
MKPQIFLAWALLGPALPASAHSQAGTGLPVRIEFTSEIRAFGIQGHTLSFGTDQMSEEGEGARKILAWKRDRITIVDTPKKRYWAGTLAEYRIGMLALRNAENKELAAMMATFRDSATGRYLNLDSCDTGHLGPYGRSIVDTASIRRPDFPGRLKVEKEKPGGGNLPTGTLAYSIRSPQGDSLGRICMRPGIGLGHVEDFAAMAAYYYEFSKAKDPFFSPSAAGFNVLAHPDVMALFRDAYPANATIRRMGPCGREDAYTFGKPLFGTKAGITGIPKDFRRVALKEVLE